MTWPMVRLGDVGRLVRGKGIKRTETLPKGCPCIRYGEIYTSYEYILDKPKSFVPKHLYDSCPHVKHGDLVLSLTGENKEEIAKTLAYLGDEEIAAGGDLAIWTGHGCDAKYLAYLMYSPTMIKAKADASNGHIVVHASVKKLEEINIPLPPLAEQKKIVARLEKDLTRVEKAQAEFARVKSAAESYFRAALTESLSKINGDVKTWKEVFETRTGKLDSNRAVPCGQYPFFTCSKEPLAIDEYAFDCEALLLAGNNAAAKYDVKHYSGKFNAYQRTYVLTLRNASWNYDVFQAMLEDRLEFLRENSKGTSTKYLTMGLLESLSFIVPTTSDQAKLAEFLNEAKQRAIRLVAVAERGLSVCAKMRKAILSEAFANE